MPLSGYFLDLLITGKERRFETLDSAIKAHNNQQYSFNGKLPKWGFIGQPGLRTK